MNIGIDIDGTVSTPYCWRELLNKIFNKNLEEEDCIEYNLALLYENNDLWKIIFNNYKKEFFDNIDIRPDALEILKILKKKHICYFISARSKEEYIVKRTKDYLKHYNIDDIELHMLSSHYKVDKAKELNIDVFIEDNPNNALELAESGIKVFLLDTNYNKRVNHKNIIRVKDWNDIYVEVKMLFNIT